MRFLITGHPRSRTAWLAALFSGDGVSVFHDLHFVSGELPAALSFGAVRNVTVGVCDPSAASVWPKEACEAFNGHPIVLIERKEAREAARRWAPGLTKDVLDLWASNIARFKALATNVLTVPYESLEDNATVANIYFHCTAKVLSYQKIELFQTLKICQHTDKLVRQINNNKRFA